MKKLIQPISEALSRGETAAIAVIVESWGSTPRKAGSVLAILADGTSLGTVGGGMLEFTAQNVLREMLVNGSPPDTREYSLSSEDEGDLRMICGGDVAVHYARITPDNAALFASLNDAVNGGGDAWLALKIADGSATEFIAVSGLDETPGELHGLLGRTAIDDRVDSGYFTLPLSSAGHVYIFGGGHVAQQIVPALTRVGFSCVVYEDRPDYAKPELFPDAAGIILDDFLEIGKNITFTPSDYVVIVTRGHSNDFNVLLQTLPTKARYVGCIGSRSKMAITRDRLREKCIGETDIARLVNPIGISINSETPEEIAVSIAAQLIQVRATA